MASKSLFMCSISFTGVSLREDVYTNTICSVTQKLFIYFFCFWFSFPHPIIFCTGLYPSPHLKIIAQEILSHFISFHEEKEGEEDKEQVYLDNLIVLLTQFCRRTHASSLFLLLLVLCQRKRISWLALCHYCRCHYHY